MWLKNTEAQKIPFFAWDAAADPQKGKAGDSGNMTVYWSLDGGGEVAPSITEVGHGWYYVSPTQAQTNGQMFTLAVESATADVSIDPVSGSFDTIEAKVDTIDTATAAVQAVTDNLPNSGALTDLATATALATVDTVADAILVDTGTTL